MYTAPPLRNAKLLTKVRFAPLPSFKLELWRAKADPFAPELFANITFPLTIMSLL